MEEMKKIGDTYLKTKLKDMVLIYEKFQEKIEEKLKRLNDQSRKDNIVTFEQLGCDRIFIDEAHYFKNLFLFTD